MFIFFWAPFMSIWFCLFVTLSVIALCLKKGVAMSVYQNHLGNIFKIYIYRPNNVSKVGKSRHFCYCWSRIYYVGINGCIFLLSTPVPLFPPSKLLPMFFQNVTNYQKVAKSKSLFSILILTHHTMAFNWSGHLLILETALTWQLFFLQYYK